MNRDFDKKMFDAYEGNMYLSFGKECAKIALGLAAAAAVITTAAVAGYVLDQHDAPERSASTSMSGPHNEPVPFVR